MFKWFNGSKKEEEEDVVIPTPPPANIDVALRVRKGNYNPRYYTHPEDFNDEIANGFQKRQTQIKEIENVRKLMPQLAIEIVDGYIERQHRSIAKIHFAAFLKRHIPIQYIKRFQRKQYRMKHQCFMYEIIRELNIAYRNGLIAKSDKLDHKLSMIALEHEIQNASHLDVDIDKQIHALNMCYLKDDLLKKADEIASLKRDKNLYRLYMRMLKKDILYNHRRYLEVFESKQDQKYFMKLVLNELKDFCEQKFINVEEIARQNMALVLQELKQREAEIQEIYEDYQEDEDSDYPVNKHLRVLSEDNDFMQWGTIDPFIVIPEIQDMPFFSDLQVVEPIFIECDFSNLEENSLFPINSENLEKEKNDLEKEKTTEEKMEEGNGGTTYREGYLKIFLGSMFSGKSSRILFELSCMADQRFRCLYVNHVKDERKTESQDKFVTTHNSSYSKISPKIYCVKVSNLGEVNATDFDYIAIDELQFFDNENTVSTVLEWVKQGKYVLIASLDGDAYRRKFGKVLDLLPHADKVKKLTAYCDMCRDNYGRLKPAPFTARMTSDTTAELVGGADLYKAMCRECHDFHLDVTVRKY